MATIPTLPPDFGDAKPALDRFFQENSALTRKLSGPTRRPDPPRSLVAQSGSLEVLLTWNAPQRNDDVVGWRVYKDVESNLIDSLKDKDARTIHVKVPANTTTSFFVSSVNALGRESIKVQVIGKANTDKFVVSGTTGQTSGTTSAVPAEYSSEPTGGLPSSR